MTLKNFSLLISADHFPGYNLKNSPFYITVQYRIEHGRFDGVHCMIIPSAGIGKLYNSAQLEREIEAAAKHNFETLVKPKVVDLNDEAYNNLKKQITY